MLMCLPPWRKSGFSPLSLSGLLIWPDSSGLSLGSSVASWPDQSGNGYDFTQATGSKQPTVVEVNGRPALSLDAVDDGMASVCNLVRPFSLIHVEKPRGFGFRTLQSGNYNSLICLNRYIGNACYLSGNVSNYYVNDTNIHLSELYVPAIGNATWYVDGIDRTQDPGGNDWGVLGIGTGGAFNIEYANSTLCEIIAVNHVLTPEERTPLREWIAPRWGLTL